MEVGRLRRNTNEVQVFEQHSRLAPDLRLLEHRFLIYVSASDHLAEKKVRSLLKRLSTITETVALSLSKTKKD